MRVKIGLSQSPRELDLEVEDPEAVAGEIEAALGNGERLLWVTESDGRRHGIVVDKVAYVDIEPDKRHPGNIGFGKE